MKLLLSFWPHSVQLSLSVCCSAKEKQKNSICHSTSLACWSRLVTDWSERLGRHFASLSAPKSFLGPRSFKLVSLWTSTTSSVSSCISTLQRPSNESRSDLHVSARRINEVPEGRERANFQPDYRPTNVHQIGDVTTIGKSSGSQSCALVTCS
jgi:hypothetical protein